jgi:hypothetical protein
VGGLELFFPFVSFVGGIFGEGLRSRIEEDIGTALGTFLLGFSPCTSLIKRYLSSAQRWRA